jgi:hypothetical protein
VGSLKPDTQNFNRLLVSVGLIAIALAVVAPWFVYRDTGVLTISTAKLATLTRSARASLIDRQHILNTVQDALPFVASALILVGLSFLVWGGVRMKEAQSWEDRSQQAQTRQQEASIEPQTPEEKELRQREAVAEEILAEVPATVAESSSRQTVDDGQGGGQTPHPLTQALPSIQEWAQLARDIERDVLAHVASITPASLRFDAQVKVSSPDGVQILLDGLLHSPAPEPDIVVEVKVRRALGAAVALSVPIDADGLLANLVRFRGATGRDAFGWLIVVFAGDDATPTQLESTQNQLSQRLLPFAKSTIARRDEIDTIALPEFPKALRYITYA